jgi:tetratricopeptide (TPR) repeat protein
MKVYISTISLPGSPVIHENPLPYFRDRKYDRKITSDDSLLPEHFENAGKNLAFRVLPYKMQDNYYRKRNVCSVKTAVLENDVMAATFLPDFGGKLYSLYNKRDKRELLFKNPVIQPANIALRDAWLSGGIEWNIGRTGHTYHTCAPVFFQKCTDTNGEMFLRMFEYDRCEGLCFSIEFRLPKGSGSLFASVKIANSRNEDVPMYWWTNIAVRETADMRVLAAADKVIYQNPRGGFGFGQMPYLDSVPGKDASFPSVYHYASEYFFQTPDTVQYPWEAAVYPSENWFFAEYSTAELKYRKMFTWGTHQGGRKWRDFLSDPGKGDYIEIQAGIARTQLHGLTMPANAVWTFTQAFTGINADAAAICGMEYHKAAETAAGLFNRETPEFASEKYAEYISFGSGWGALEQCRRKIRGIDKLPLDFPESSIGKEELPWLNLLVNGNLPDNTDSFMIGSDWRSMLEKDGGKEALVHLGVMYYEDGMEKEAVAAWEKSLPHALAYRNLSLAERKNDNFGKALILMEKAVQLNDSASYKSEYADLLIKAKEYDKCWSLLSVLSDNASSRLWVYRAQCAWHTGRYDELEKMFGREYSCIREGETALTDLWFMWAEKTGQNNKTNPPPHIDFRMQ